MSNIALLRNKVFEEECSAPWDYQATLRFLWRKYSAGGIYE